MVSESTLAIAPILDHIDYFIVGVIVFSVVVSIIRGFVREAFSLVTWAAAFGAAIFYCTDLATLLEHKISIPTLRLMVSFSILFLGILILGAIISSLLSRLIKSTGLSGTDRVLGIFFGLVRGVMVIALCVLAGQYTQLSAETSWKKSILIPRFEVLADWLHQVLPQELKRIAGDE